MTMPFQWLGTQPYEAMWERLKHRAGLLALGQKDELIWACEHEPVYTTGKRAIDNSQTQSLGNIAHGNASNIALPAPFIVTDRGGETTFHGTGQIMLYPIIHLRKRALSVRNYIHILEQSAIQTLAQYGIVAERRCSLPGVWTNEGKIVALGIRISQGVAYHGMAMNISVDMKYFDAIKPCGLERKAVNMHDIQSETPPMYQLAQAWAEQLDSLLNSAG
ncbi:MAG: lipoyl(octanoyl) transferase LipB [Mariprofundaceae bacterium]|nr:lipoyl(octanoyl) transferase LipB [Mariprofundaceae bacterium]